MTEISIKGSSSQVVGSDFYSSRVCGLWTLMPHNQASEGLGRIEIDIKFKTE